MQKLWFLYFGRLDPEKWFDAIIEMIERFWYGREELPFQIFVFGEGAFVDKIEELSDTYEEVHYLGFQPLPNIFRYIENCHYCLMPSTFLETFGLSAVNALWRGLPVVAYKKWGLDPFVFEGLDLSNYEGISTADHIESFVRVRMKAKDREKQKKKFYSEALKISDKYHQADREKKIFKLIEKPYQRVLMVSDFANRIAWIETYIHDASKALIWMENTVDVFGSWGPRGKFGKIWRYGGMFLSFFNIFFALRLLIKIIRFKPDVIWFHSTIRRMWWLWYFAAKLSKSKNTQTWQMFHDFGYFYPFPNKLTDIKQIKTPLTRVTFVASSWAWTFGMIKKILVWGKYINLSLLKYFAKKSVDKFLVPSQYMENIVSKSWKISKKKVEVLEHFVQE